MDYEKKYNEAIKRAKQHCADYVVETIFSELKESEGERIRQDIITTLSMGVACEESALHPGAHTTLKEAIVWLEKQCENNMGISEATKRKLVDNLNEALGKETPESLNEFLDEQGEKHIDRELSNLLHRVICRFINDPNIPYSERDEVSKKIIPYVEQLEKQGEHANFINKIQVGDKVTRNEDGVLVNLSQLNRVAKKQGEQKPAWSEENEKKVNNLYVFLDQMVSFNMLSNKDATEFKDWLKSLKERYTWKPSDEQMEALLKLEEMHVLEREKNQENAHLYMVVKSIREQLLKLREE